MHDGKYFLFFIGAIGAFNGLILAIYFVFLTKKRNLAGIFLGGLLGVLSLRIGKAVMVYFEPSLVRLYLQIGLSACLFIGPFLYFFVRTSLEQKTEIPVKWKYQLLLGLLLITGIGVLFPYSVYPKLWNLYLIKVIYAVWFAYVIATGLALKDNLDLLRRQNQSVKQKEKWLMAIYAANLIICCCFILALFFKSFQLYYSGAIAFSLLFYAMIGLYFYQGKTTEQFYRVSNKSSIKKLADANTLSLLEKLDDAMCKNKLYKNASLTVNELAKTINIPSHQLSQLLNDHLEKNFTSYVNEYRINEACQMIADGHQFSLEAIGYEVGFNSKSTFYTAFKKIKATTPLLYKENLFKAVRI